MRAMHRGPEGQPRDPFLIPPLPLTSCVVWKKLLRILGTSVSLWSLRRLAKLALESSSNCGVGFWHQWDPIPTHNFGLNLLLFPAVEAKTTQCLWARWILKWRDLLGKKEGGVLKSLITSDKINLCKQGNSWWHSSEYSMLMIDII